MNRIYRIVFNRALGIWQVASELVKRLGGLARGDGGAVTVTVPTLRFAMWCALGFVSLAATLDSSPVYAQDAGRILVDRTAPGNQRPSVTDSPSGAPVVNITTPSAAGVSRNAYSQFDVGTQGAILNNSRKGADTQLGGQIVGNPNLITGTARVILNEVNGPASQLNGYVEVAGNLSADEAYALSSQKKFDEAYAALSATDRADYDRIAAKANNGIDLTAAEKVRLSELEQKLGWVHVDSLTPEMFDAANAELNRIAITKYGAGSSWMVENPQALMRQFDTYTTGQRLDEANTSAESQIISGGDLTLDSGGVVRNYASRIAAGGNLTIGGGARLENIAVAGQYTGNRATTAWIFVPPVKTQYTDGRGTHDDIAEFAATMNEVLVTTGPNVADGSIKANEGVFIDAGDVTNAAVTAGAGLNALNGGDLNGAGSTSPSGANSANANTAGGVNAANGQQVSGSTGPGGAQGGTAGPQIGPSGAAAQFIGTADRPLPNLVAADNGMFDLNADPNAKFLVTTAPRFAKGGPWDSSDYLLNALRTDPNNIHKRLGDGYYEQRLVMEQVFQLTGRRSLNGDGDANAQYRALMDNAATTAGRLGLQLGAPLTSAQIAALDSDIVWLVEQEVNGQKVLVPVVYLSKATAERMAAEGALIDGDTLSINSTGTVRNDGTLSADKGAFLSADTLINDGTINGGAFTGITTRGDTVNRGRIEGNAIAIDAGGSVINTVRFDGMNATGGVINAGTGGLQVTAGLDVINQGQMASAGHTVVTAGRDFVQNAATNITTAAGTIRAPAGSLTTGGSAVITAGRDVALDQSSITAGQHVVIDAGRDAHFTAADVTAGGSITSAEQSLDQTNSSYFKQSGLNVAVGGGAVDSLRSGYDAAQRGSEVEDDRLKALYAAQAGYAAADAASAMQASGSATGGANVRITVGSQRSESEVVTHEVTHRGSNISSGGNVVINATGDGKGNGGNLTIVGSNVDGKNVGLLAANNLTIQSSENSYRSESRSRSQGGEIGVAISASNSGAAAGLYVAANAARGKGDGEGVSHNESHITARDTLVFSSGNDTTLQGAQLAADRVIGKVGHDLTVRSEQDVDRYKNENASAQGSMTVGYGFDGQASASYSQMDSDYASVKEQTGIQAGKGGYDIYVGNHTQLAGAAIASTADPSLNRFSTGSLSVTDIKNKADYSAMSASVSTSGGNQTGTAPMSGHTSPGGSVPQSEHSSSTTRSGISAGTVDIRNGDTGALASLDRSVTGLQQDGLKPIFDEQKVAERLEMGEVAGRVGFRAAGDIAGAMQKDALEDLKTARANGDKEAEAQAQARLDSWSEGGANKAILHGVIGAGMAALGGGNVVGGALAAGGVEAAKDDMARYLVAHGVEYGSAAFETLMSLGSAALGGAIGGGSGASTALAGDVYNRQLHQDELSYIAAKADEYAKAAGISEKEAEQRLLYGALMANDTQLSKDVVMRTRLEGNPDVVLAYEQAYYWLIDQADKSGFKIINENGQQQAAFSSSYEQQNNHDLFAQSYRDASLLPHAVDNLFNTDYANTRSVTLGDYADAMNGIRFQSQYAEWRASKPADPAQWTEADWVEWRKLDTEGSLRQMAGYGMFGGAGQLAINVADGNFRQIKNDAAINLATGLPIIKVGPAEKAVEGLSDAAKIGAAETKADAIWSSTKSLTSVENALGHWNKHRKDFPELHNAKEYVEASQRFVTDPPAGALVKVRSNGDRVIYDPASNTLAVQSANGAPRTMFKPNPSEHGYQSNMDYFNAQ